jgi:hemoglobin
MRACYSYPRLSAYVPTPDDLPFARVGGEAAVRALVERFYDTMEKLEPALAALHERDEAGNVSRAARDRFALFLIGWLGGPQDYVARHGHPRLRMRHARVPVDRAMRDAWLRSMRAALDESRVEPGVRGYLDARFAEVADFMRNLRE